jgi:hypothetical protein
VGRFLFGSTTICQMFIVPSCTARRNWRAEQTPADTRMEPDVLGPLTCQRTRLIPNVRRERAT